MQNTPMSSFSDVSIEPLQEKDLDEASRIVRFAFGTFLGLPEPTQMFGDKETIANRWRANPSSVFGAYSEGKLVGSNVVTGWGSFWLVRTAYSSAGPLG